ncbi:MAG TPA: hypothetical protein PKE36_11625, partial [Chiayiivirga sp.]|nr:hypothetical protein [Chiayiivirga sp.]
GAIKKSGNAARTFVDCADNKKVCGEICPDMPFQLRAAAIDNELADTQRQWFSKDPGGQGQQDDKQHHEPLRP